MIPALKFQKVQLAAISSLAGSNMAAAAILAVGTIFLARLVSPATFGLYSIASQAALTIYPFLTLRYEHALPLLGRNRPARELLLLSTIGFSLSASITCIVIVYIAIITVGSRIELNREYIYMAPAIIIAALSFSMASILQQSILAQGAVHRVGLSKAARAAVQFILQIGSAFAIGGSAIWLIMAEAVASFVQAVILFLGLIGLSAIPRILDKRTNLFRRAWVLIVRHRVFPLITLPHMLIHGLLALATAALIGAYHGADSLGQYYLMRKLVWGFLGVIGLAAAQHAIADASQRPRTELYPIALRTVLVILCVSMPAGAVLVMFGPSIFVMVGGDEWAEAGRIAAASGTIVVIEPVTAALSFVPVFLGRQGFAFLVAVLQGGVGVVSVALASQAGWPLTEVVFVSSNAIAFVMTGYVAWLLLQARRAQGTSL